jgi:hypothetical protein
MSGVSSSAAVARMISRGLVLGRHPDASRREARGLRHPHPLFEEILGVGRTHDRRVGGAGPAEHTGVLLHGNMGEQDDRRSAFPEDSAGVPNGVPGAR